jgi:hypothetical protein
VARHADSAGRRLTEGAVTGEEDVACQVASRYAGLPAPWVRPCEKMRPTWASTAPRTGAASGHHGRGSRARPRAGGRGAATGWALLQDRANGTGATGQAVAAKAAVSAAHWTTHTGAQLKFDIGEFTPAQTKAAWAASKATGPQDVAQFLAAVQAYHAEDGK